MEHQVNLSGARANESFRWLAGTAQGDAFVFLDSRLAEPLGTAALR
jgi:hypothetical protein